ncbi:MAG: hypothetical protein Q7S09_05800, partial [bacterium]|nr:hypothetical protein [bacterium]
MCGIVGFYNVSCLKSRATDGFATIQHRGVEGSGFLASKLDGSDFFYLRRGSLAKSLCDSDEFYRWEDRETRIAIEHVRFGTSGSPADLRNIQPFMHFTRWGKLAVAHNGDRLDTQTVRQTFLDGGMVFESDSDS